MFQFVYNAADSQIKTERARVGESVVYDKDGVQVDSRFWHLESFVLYLKSIVQDENCIVLPAAS
jgi:hypothetical protein